MEDTLVGRGSVRIKNIIASKYLLSFVFTFNISRALPGSQKQDSGGFLLRVVCLLLAVLNICSTLYLP